MDGCRPKFWFLSPSDGCKCQSLLFKRARCVGSASRCWLVGKHRVLDGHFAANFIALAIQESSFPCLFYFYFYFFWEGRFSCRLKFKLVFRKELTSTLLLFMYLQKHTLYFWWTLHVRLLLTLYKLWWEYVVLYFGYCKLLPFWVSCFLYKGTQLNYDYVIPRYKRTQRFYYPYSFD